MTREGSVLAGFVLLVGSACYRPAAITECTVSCEDSACPAGLSCGSDMLCYRPGGLECFAIDPDARIDPPSLVCPASSLFASRCFTPASGTLVLDGPVVTDLDPRCAHMPAAPNTPVLAPGWCVMAAEMISVTGVVRATGTRALVLVASDSIRVETTGVIDVASYDDPGAAASFGGCTVSTGTASEAGGQGGAGGTFRGAGGAGGVGGGGGTVSSIGGISVSFVRGGCPGDIGGTGETNADFGKPGNGGGALVLYAESTIEIAGELNASGAAGYGGTLKSGGGGGGSGGLIVLDAATIYVPSGGVVHAHGGGGATGSTATVMGLAGTRSMKGVPAGATPAPGPAAGAGGRGNTTASFAGGGGSTGIDGGGGGGGGAGWIVLLRDGSPQLDGFVTPR